MTIQDAVESKGEKYAAGFKLGEADAVAGNIKMFLIKDPDAKRDYQDALDAHKHRTQYHAK